MEMEKRPLREWGVIITGAIGYSIGFIAAVVIVCLFLYGNLKVEMIEKGQNVVGSGVCLGI